jgi:hypothetical protein
MSCIISTTKGNHTPCFISLPQGSPLQSVPSNGSRSGYSTQGVQLRVTNRWGSPTGALCRGSNVVVLSVGPSRKYHQGGTLRGIPCRGRSRLSPICPAKCALPGGPLQRSHPGSPTRGSPPGGPFQEDHFRGTLNGSTTGGLLQRSPLW